MTRKISVQAAIVVLGLITMLGLVANGFALPDYSKCKGDFKIFNIGDTRAEVLRKLAYLEAQGEIGGISGAEYFLGETLGEKMVCKFRFHKSLFGGERVRQIVIDFTGHHSLPAQFEFEVKEYAKYLRTVLDKTYGPPSYTRPSLFITQLKLNQEKYIVKWVFQAKIVGIAFVYKPEYITTLIIISSRLMEQELQKDEIQDFN